MIRFSAAAMGTGVKFTGKFATAADAMLEWNHNRWMGGGVANAHQCDDWASLCWSIRLVRINRDLCSLTITPQLTRISPTDGLC